VKASPFTSEGRVNPTFESALIELLFQLRLKERTIVQQVLA
jgi:hypothetical protein